MRRAERRAERPTRPGQDSWGRGGPVQPSIRITLLGGFAVTVNGVDCDVPEAASRLVALLALRPHGNLPRRDRGRSSGPTAGS